MYCKVLKMSIMSGFVDRAIKYLNEFSFIRYIRGEGKCRFSTTSKVFIHKSAVLKNCTFFVLGNSEVSIGANVQLINAEVYVEDGTLHIAESSIVEGTSIGVDPKCMFLLGHHSRLSAKRVWLRFGGALKVGCYTNINHDSEIRADEHIEIGSYCQISQYVNIWDTNTHSILSPSIRRKRTEDFFPFFGKELSRPRTKPIIIGDDCWIGERCSIMKGTQIGNNVIVGYNTTLVNQSIPDNKTVVQDIRLRAF